MINDVGARIAGACAEVLDVEIEGLHDARREKNGGAAWRTTGILAENNMGGNTARKRRQAKEA
jgi:hypothetical protein